MGKKYTIAGDNGARIILATGHLITMTVVVRVITINGIQAPPLPSTSQVQMKPPYVFKT